MQTRSKLLLRAKSGRMHIRIDENLLRHIKQIALDKRLTLTQLVEASFRRILQEEGILRAVRKNNDVEQV